MKLTLTIDEVKAAVARVVGINGEYELKIMYPKRNKKNPLLQELLERMNTEGCFTLNNVIRPDQKIQSIKVLRQFIMDKEPYTCGLAQAKFAVENWTAFCKVVGEKGIPRMGSGDQDWRIAAGVSVPGW
jgi:hypothetical protein